MLAPVVLEILMPVRRGIALQFVDHVIDTCKFL